jgi:hypothetical protein
MATMEMLVTSPTGVPADVDAVAAAIDTCLDCVGSCTVCADADLAEAAIDEMRTCIARCLDCADVCGVTARLLSRPSHWEGAVLGRLLQACVRVCTLCSEECARHAHHHRHCALCQHVCDECVQACSTLLGADAFNEVQS